ncbi:50S ribosomal protein L32e [Candidatus Micrarchaeota archaeon]|nr:50S ribosomal protein L32e [Candidatus Micrarchaeota archaeon]
MASKKSKPKFNVLNAGFKKRVKHRWRKPRGVDNKKRIRCSFAGASPRIGYKNSAEARGTHPCGLKEVLVNNPSELKSAAGNAVRIASGVGKRKRDEIKKLATELKITVLN